MAEAHGTQSWLDHARTCNYIDDEQYRELDDAWQKIGGKLNRMIQSADSFCSEDGLQRRRPRRRTPIHHLQSTIHQLADFSLPYRRFCYSQPRC